ncbi:MAG: hypothetical protein HC861_03565 [Rhodospirillaceae bacterium]|nr:hypothetical protein [Rhodospirillaceae bacterium]
MAHLKIALFILFLLAPVAALLSFGVVEDYGRVQTRFPPLDKLLLAKKGRFDQLGDAVLERSIVQRLAVQLRNWVGYRLVGFVDNERLVSGNDGWLFYRPEFTDGRCLDESETTARLRRFAVLMDVGRAAGIDMLMTMSPDKSTIYPEALNSTIRGYWRCRTKNSATLRRLIKQELPDLIDHTEPLLTEKARHPETTLYYVTDTHWTQYGGAIALRQLLAALYPDAHIPEPRLSAATTTRKTDLARMLLLSIEEQGPRADPLLARDIELPDDGRPAIRTLIIRDSFYGAITREILDAFPDPVVLLPFNQGDRLLADGVSADRLIINAIERKFVTLEGDVLAWDSPISIAIVNRNIQQAQECGAFHAADGTIGGDETNPRDVAIRAVAPGRLPCLRLSLAAEDRVTLDIALPDPTTGAFEPGRTLEYRIKSDSRTIAFVLPAYAAGSNVRVSSDDDAAISAIEVGEIPQPSPPGAAGSDQP